MLSAFKSVTSITESRKLISYLCAYAEKFREKQTNQLGLNCLKIDSYSQNLLENEERKCRPPPIPWRHNLLHSYFWETQEKYYTFMASLTP